MGLKMFSFLKPYLFYLYLALFVGLLSYVGIQKYSFYSLQKALQSKEKIIQEKEQTIKDKENTINALEINLNQTLKINETNNLFIAKLEQQREDDMRMIRKIKKDNDWLEYRKNKLIKTINKLRDENLSENDREFIQALYSKKDKK